MGLGFQVSKMKTSHYCTVRLITLLLKNQYYSNKDNSAWSEVGMGEMSFCFPPLDFHLLNIMLLMAVMQWIPEVIHCGK
jgi:hypothetical protein